MSTNKDNVTIALNSGCTKQHWGQTRMKQTSLLLSIVYFFSLPLFCMEDNHPLAIPDVTRLVAYTLIDSFSPKKDSLVEPHKQLLTNIRYFSKTNKQIYVTMRALTHGPIENKPAQDFNKHLIAHMQQFFKHKKNPRLLAQAYLGTPCSLSNWQLPLDVNGTFDIEQLQWDLDRQVRIIVKYTRTYEGPPSGFISSLCSYSEDKEYKPETIEETLEKFPQSTQQFCKNLLRIHN